MFKSMGEYIEEREHVRIQRAINLIQRKPVPVRQYPGLVPTILDTDYTYHFHLRSASPGDTNLTERTYCVREFCSVNHKVPAHTYEDMGVIINPLA